jgi:PAS domain S-box-containing protein
LKILRHLVLILFFAGLVSLEIWHGIFRLQTLARRQRDETLEAIRRDQSELARVFTKDLEAEREHAKYIVKVPMVRKLLQASEAEEDAIRERLREDLLPYHSSFLVIDRMSLFDLEGRERYRMHRQGGGPAALSKELLGKAEGRMANRIQSLIAGGSSEPVISELEIESERVYVPESDRQVIRYANLVRERDRRLGVAVLTLYAAPMLDAVRRRSAERGILRTLIDGEGRFLAHPDRRRERLPDPGLASDFPRGAAAILRGEKEARDGDALLIATPVAGGLPGWRLVTIVPDSAVQAASISIRGEYGWIIGSIGATTLVLILAGGFFLRLSIREVRLAESGRYLERIRRESARYRALMEGAGDMILIVAPDRELIREANALARTTLGLAQGEAHLDDVLPAAHRAVFRERLSAAAAGTPSDLPEIRIRMAGGKEMSVSARLAGVDLEDERVVEVSLRDLTRQKEMERQLRISERLGSLGLLTAGVAHEINNPLEGIENYLALLDREGTDASRRSRYLEMIRYGFRRIRDIVRDLSSFARPEVKGSTADLREVVERALGMVRYDRAFRTIEVDRKGFDSPLVVLGDAGRLEQVFINLLLNAARAMKSAGRIAITARAADAGAEAHEPWVEVIVEDTGPGIPEDVIGRIFDPFFSTGDGAGLGLSISYGILRALGGDIRAENRAEGGARFVLRLPAAGAPGSGAGQAESGTAAPAPGTSGSPQGTVAGGAVETGRNAS